MQVVNIGGDTDDAMRRGGDTGNELQDRVCPINMPINGILIGEHALGESLTDDRDRIFLIRVEFIEVAPGDDGNSQRREKSGRDDAELGARIFARNMSMPIGRKLQT